MSALVPTYLLNSPSPVASEPLRAVAEGQRPGVLSLQVDRPTTADVLAELTLRLFDDHRQLCCIDAGHSFHSHAFSNAAYRQRRDPRAVLEQVFVTRCFTIHQLAAVACELLPEVAQRDCRPVVAVLGIDYLFLEETLPLWERKYVLGEVLGGLTALRAEGLSVLLTHAPPLPGRGWWKPIVESRSEHRARIVPSNQRGWLLLPDEGKAASPRTARMIEVE